MDRQFPPEIVQLIVEASLDPFDPSDDLAFPRARYLALKSYSLINSIWRGISEPLLCQWVVLWSEASTLNFLEAVEGKGREAERVRGLYVWAGNSRDQSIPSKILKFTPHISHLNLAFGRLDVNDLAPLQQLRRLTTYRTTVGGSPASLTLALPSLEYLSITISFIEEPAASHFLTPAFLPQLRYLDLSQSRRASSTQFLLRQLEAVEVLPGDDHFLTSTTNSLLLLRLPSDNADRIRMLSHLTSLPPFLSIDFECLHKSRGDERLRLEIHRVLEHLLTITKAGLRVVLLRDLAVNGELGVVIERLEDRGIRVMREEKELTFLHAIERMEEILEEERWEAEKAEV